MAKPNVRTCKNSSFRYPFLTHHVFYSLPCILPNLRVATAARHAEHAPINKQTAIAFGPSVPWCSSGGPSLNSGLLPGSRMEKTTQEMPVPMNCGSVVYRFMMPRYCPELAPPLDAPPAFAFSRLSWASEMSIEARFGCVECEVAVFRRLISTPRKANGAQEATAHDLCSVSLLTWNSWYSNHLHATASNDDGAKPQTRHKGRHDHATREDAVRSCPRCQ